LSTFEWTPGAAVVGPPFAVAAAVVVAAAAVDDGVDVEDVGVAAERRLGPGGETLEAPRQDGLVAAPWGDRVEGWKDSQSTLLIDWLCF